MRDTNTEPTWSDLGRQKFGQSKRQIRIPARAGAQDKRWIVEEHELGENKRKYWVSEPSERAYEGNLVKVIETEEMTHYICDGRHYKHNGDCCHCTAVEQVEWLAAI